MEQTDLKWANDPIIYRVIYGDTDKAGVMYYATYLRLFEIGRTEWLRNCIGHSYRSLEKEGILFPVVEAYIRYKAPAGYDDLLEIHTALGRFSPVSITFHYEIRRNDQVLVTGTTKHAAINGAGKLTKIPQGLIDAFDKA